MANFTYVNCRSIIKFSPLDPTRTQADRRQPGGGEEGRLGWVFLLFQSEDSFYPQYRYIRRSPTHVFLILPSFCIPKKFHPDLTEQHRNEHTPPFISDGIWGSQARGVIRGASHFDGWMGVTGTVGMNWNSIWENVHPGSMDVGSGGIQ